MVVRKESCDWECHLDRYPDLQKDSPPLYIYIYSEELTGQQKSEFRRSSNALPELGGVGHIFIGAHWPAKIRVQEELQRSSRTRRRWGKGTETGATTEGHVGEIPMAARTQPATAPTYDVLPAAL